jgi:hypothetical protein
MREQPSMPESRKTASFLFSSSAPAAFGLHSRVQSVSAVEDEKVTSGAAPREALIVPELSATLLTSAHAMLYQLGLVMMPDELIDRSLSFRASRTRLPILPREKYPRELPYSEFADALHSLAFELYQPFHTYYFPLIYVLITAFKYTSKS